MIAIDEHGRINGVEIGLSRRRFNHQAVIFPAVVGTCSVERLVHGQPDHRPLAAEYRYGVIEVIPSVEPANVRRPEAVRFGDGLFRPLWCIAIEDAARALPMD